MEVIAIPKKFYAGDSLRVTASLASYPASAGWSVSLVIVNSSYNYQVDSSASGDDHVLAAVPTVTDDWIAGVYKWIAFAIKSTTDRVRVSSGDIEIFPDIVADVKVDLRSHAERVLAAIELVLEGKAASDDYQTSVRGKMLTRYSYEELLSLRKAYRAEVMHEKRALAKQQGKAGASQIRVRF